MDYNKQEKSPKTPFIKGGVKRIGIDARFYGPIGKGLGRYTKEVVDNILTIDNENEYVIFLRQENFDEFEINSPKIKKVLANINWYGWREQIIFPFYIWREHLDLMHFPHFNVPVFCPAKFIVTIHDLILIKFPTVRATTLGPILYKIKNFAYRFVISTAVKKAKKIIAVSEFTKKDIIEQFKVNPEKVKVTYEGVSENSFSTKDKIGSKKTDKETLLGYNIHSPFLLYVGNAYPHKNLEGLIRVFSKIGDKNINLVLVGKGDYFYARLKSYSEKLGLWKNKDKNSKIVFPGYVPDNDLKIMYQNALIYVFPSFYEGFGLPPLEAMAQGCPVVSSNKTSMPEILGDAVVYFNPENEDEMLDKIKSYINNEDLRQILKKKGFEQAKKYSWQNCAKKTLEIYKNELI